MFTPPPPPPNYMFTPPPPPPQLYVYTSSLYVYTSPPPHYMCSFERAIQFPHMYAKTLNNLATLYYRLGKKRSGLTSRFVLWLLYTFLGRYKEAESRFRESIQLTSDQATAYNNLGNSSKSLHTPQHVSFFPF